MTRTRLLVIAVLLAVVGFGAYSHFFRGLRQSDLAPLTDNQVDGWAVKYEQRDALEFLLKGGVYADALRPKPGMDKDVIVPFLKRLDAETKLRAVVFLYKENANMAGGAAIAIPKNRDRRRDLERFMLKEEREYDGVIVRQYGERWLYFSFYDAEQAKEMKLADWNVE